MNAHRGKLAVGLGIGFGAVVLVAGAVAFRVMDIQAAALIAAVGVAAALLPLWLSRR